MMTGTKESQSTLAVSNRLVNNIMGELVEVEGRLWEAEKRLRRTHKASYAKQVDRLRIEAARLRARLSRAEAIQDAAISGRLK